MTSRTALRVRIEWLLVLATVGGVLACDAPPSVAPPHVADAPSSETPDAPVALIGPEGGSLALDSGTSQIRLIVPPGALDAPQRLTIEAHRGPVDGAVGAVYDLGPSGTHFARPVTVAITRPPHSPGVPILDVLVVATAGPSGWEALEPAATERGEVAGFTSHFSMFGLIERPDGNLRTAGHQGEVHLLYSADLRRVVRMERLAADATEWVCAPVLATSVREVDTLVDLEVDPDRAGPLLAYTLTGTLEHPFFVPVRGAYVPMGELEVGDAVMGEDGASAVVVGVAVRYARAVVFNLEVGEVHSYSIGGGERAWTGVLVHNTTGYGLFVNKLSEGLAQELATSRRIGVKPIRG